MPRLHDSVAYCFGPCDRIVSLADMTPCEDCGVQLCDDCRKSTSDPDLFLCARCSHMQRRVLKGDAHHAA